ncbi:MAG: reverse transcriptase domain-containing protein [Polyangiales bacterium]
MTAGRAAGLLCACIGRCFASSCSRAPTRPALVRRQMIPKSGGGTRELGILTVVDLVRSASHSAGAEPSIRSDLLEHSTLRPRRSAHDAVVQAQRYIGEGRRVVVDVDLEKLLRPREPRRADGEAREANRGQAIARADPPFPRSRGDGGRCRDERHEGTPQGGPLSPLLANVPLDDVDKELEKRGHAFVRYADDCNVYARGRGERAHA